MSQPRSIRLVRDEFSDRPAFDTAVSRALLIRASEGVIPETFRLNVPGRVVAFGKRDTLEPGYPEAVAAAADEGFASVERLAGGRAAVFTEHTLAFSWTIPHRDPRRGIYARFQALAGLMARTFDGLGVPAEVGEIPGEYCPGDYSVHHGGRIKLMGVGQRLASAAAHVGGVVVVDRPDLVRRVLVPVYDRLGLDWEPTTAGALTDVRPGLTVASVASALIAELARSAVLVEDTIGVYTLALAERLAPDHEPTRV
jgi:lipoate-protein ligase A